MSKNQKPNQAQNEGNISQYGLASGMGRNADELTAPNYENSQSKFAGIFGYNMSKSGAMAQKPSVYDEIFAINRPAFDQATYSNDIPQFTRLADVQKPFKVEDLQEVEVIEAFTTQQSHSATQEDALPEKYQDNAITRLKQDFCEAKGSHWQCAAQVQREFAGYAELFVQNSCQVGAVLEAFGLQWKMDKAQFKTQAVLLKSKCDALKTQRANIKNVFNFCRGLAEVQLTKLESAVSAYLHVFRAQLASNATALRQLAQQESTDVEKFAAMTEQMTHNAGSISKEQAKTAHLSKQLSLRCKKVIKHAPSCDMFLLTAKQCALYANALDDTEFARTQQIINSISEEFENLRTEMLEMHDNQSSSALQLLETTRQSFKKQIQAFKCQILNLRRNANVKQCARLCRELETAKSQLNLESAKARRAQQQLKAQKEYAHCSIAQLQERTEHQEQVIEAMQTKIKELAAQLQTFGKAEPNKHYHAVFSIESKIKRENLNFEQATELRSGLPPGNELLSMIYENDLRFFKAQQ